MRKKKSIRLFLTAAVAAVMIFCHGDPAMAEIMDRTDHLLRDKSENDRFLKELASGHTEPGRHEFLVEGEDYVPDTLILAQRFPALRNISNTVLGRVDGDGGERIRSRIGFEWFQEEMEGFHRYEEGILKKPSCTGYGDLAYFCSGCGDEIHAAVPPMGHLDEDGDGRCDRCLKACSEQPERRNWSLGDLTARKLGSRTYLFRCIDEDYGDAGGEHQNLALFLCDSVIRSDFDRDYPNRNQEAFGNSNHYKTSEIRMELKKQPAWKDQDLSDVYTGVNTAFTGETEDRAFETCDPSSMKKMEIPYQELEDRIFFLSVEEAFRYREEIFRSEIFPEEMRSAPGKRGYWLRTPVYQTDEKGTFLDGTGIYVVDLEHGKITSALCTDPSIGIRPAFCIPQG